MMTKIDPMNQSLSVEVVPEPTDLEVCMCLVHTISMMGPLYKVITIAPATVTIVPTTFAWHLTLFMSIFSILFNSIMSNMLQN